LTDFLRRQAISDGEERLNYIFFLELDKYTPKEFLDLGTDFPYFGIHSQNIQFYIQNNRNYHILTDLRRRPAIADGEEGPNYIFSETRLRKSF